MPHIHFIQVDGSTKTIDAPVGLSVMEVAVKHAMDKIEGACGGSLACATCHVYVHPDWWDKVLPDEGEIDEAEEDMLDLAFNLTKLSRLSCQIIVSDELDGLVVALPGSKPDWV
ncbi:MAG TPA: 2Fe-2S iron-sulfur cluster-binding protein [Alphaproteobacteria bacterium]|nr:2Fe-2S iron-sulfur cluster binding domain-containing protein [Alphaproteobacteria bacterium]HOO51078.1 2Fe-2S iron-sulfur cluster-binding protein [Alphaproteobacteria bacterium]